MVEDGWSHQNAERSDYTTMTVQAQQMCKTIMQDGNKIRGLGERWKFAGRMSMRRLWTQPKEEMGEILSRTGDLI